MKIQTLVTKSNDGLFAHYTGGIVLGTLFEMIGDQVDLSQSDATLSVLDNNNVLYQSPVVIAVSSQSNPQFFELEIKDNHLFEVEDVHLPCNAGVLSLDTSGLRLVFGNQYLASVMPNAKSRKEHVVSVQFVSDVPDTQEIVSMLPTYTK